MEGVPEGRRDLLQVTGAESVRNCIANKIKITNALSIGYRVMPCQISAFREKAFNSHQPFTSISSILRFRKILNGEICGLYLEESQPQVRSFRMFCNQISNPLPYVAQPADATFRNSITLTYRHRSPMLHRLANDFLSTISGTKTGYRA
jgi:hypothetical protein